MPKKSPKEVLKAKFLYAGISVLLIIVALLAAAVFFFPSSKTPGKNIRLEARKFNDQQMRDVSRPTTDKPRELNPQQIEDVSAPAGEGARDGR